MNVLSLFDGMRCGVLALQRAGVPITKYYVSEVDKYALKVGDIVYPEAVSLGDVTNWREWDIDWSSIDLLIGGSPCQGFSFAGKQLAFDDPRSKLFFVYVDILNYIQKVNPQVKFMLENVRMKKDFIAIITQYLGVEPIAINSNLVSAQNRYRLYWTNITGIEQPQDRGIFLKDIVHEETDFIDVTNRLGSFNVNPSGKGMNGKVKPVGDPKADTLTTNKGEGPKIAFPLHEHALSGGFAEWFAKTADVRLKKKFSSLNPDKAITVTARQYANWSGNFIFEALKEYIVPFDKTLQILDKEVERGKVGYFRKDSQANRVYYIHGKAVTLCGDAGGGSAKMGQYLFGCIATDRANKRQNGQRFSEGRKFYTLTAQDKHGILIEGYIRKLTPIECGRLQTVPDAVIITALEGVSQTQMYKMLGNGWTVDVIAHIFKNLKQENIMNEKVKDFKVDTEGFDAKGDSEKEIRERILERKDKIVKPNNVIEQNGVTMPVRVKSYAYKIWEVANKLSGIHRRPPTLQELTEAMVDQDIKPDTIKNNFRKWRKFYGADAVEVDVRGTNAKKEEKLKTPETEAVTEVDDTNVDLPSWTKAKEERQASLTEVEESDFDQATIAEEEKLTPQIELPEIQELPDCPTAEEVVNGWGSLPQQEEPEVTFEDVTTDQPPIEVPANTERKDALVIDGEMLPDTLRTDVLIQIHKMLASGAINVHISETLESVGNTLIDFIDANSELIAKYHESK